jgi:hypothetical protein
LLNSGRQPSDPPPPDLEGQELSALLRIASHRSEDAESVATTDVQYEAGAWKSTLQRLDRRRVPRPKKRRRDVIDPFSLVDEAATANALHDMEVEELREVARMRKEMAERAASLAESHRDEVWRRVQSRLDASTPKKSRFVFFRRSGDKRRMDKTDDETADRTRKTRRRTYWPNLKRDAAEGKSSRNDLLWRRLAVASALGMLAIAALAPLQASGFAGHPVARAVSSFGEFIGVAETETTPQTSVLPATAEGTDITAAEASERLGVAVAVPAESPAGFALTGSLFFETAVTAGSVGLFALTYATPDGAVLAIYQERASGAEFAPGSGSATAVALRDGTTATYVEGAWQPAADGSLTWSEDGAQTLGFERDGVRTTVQYTGPEAGVPSLFAIADSLTPVD